MSPAWMIAWEPFRAARASGRSMPWVSEIMPRRNEDICIDDSSVGGGALSLEGLRRLSLFKIDVN